MILQIILTLYYIYKQTAFIRVIMICNLDQFLKGVFDK